MIKTEEIYLVDIFKSVIDAMKVPDPASTTGGFLKINYEPGETWRIIKSLAEYDNGGEEYKGLKYPLIAIVLPIREGKGSGLGSEVVIPRIIIAQLTTTNTGTEPILDKYDQNGVFKTILYPVYNEFMKCLAFSRFTAMGDPDGYEHDKMDTFGLGLNQGTNDFVDTIEIQNLECLFYQIKTC